MFIVDEKLEDYALKFSHQENSLLKELREETYQRMEWPQMLTGPIEGQFLKTLIRLSNSKVALEVGMFTGYATLSMAEALPENGRIITCEIDPAAISFASRYFSRSPHGKKIEVREGPALENIRKIDFELDFAFIDADKTNYLNYYKAIVPLLRSGGIIAVDNTLWSGKVLNPQDDDTCAIHELNTFIHSDSRVENVLLTVRDGVNLVRKK